MNIQSLETSIHHASDAVGSGLKALLHFFAAHSQQLGTAAVIAETVTGNAELIPETEAAAKAMQAGATVLDSITNTPATGA